MEDSVKVIDVDIGTEVERNENGGYFKVWRTKNAVLGV